MPATKAASPPAPPAPLSGWQQRASQFFCLLVVFGFPIFRTVTVGDYEGGQRGTSPGLYVPMVTVNPGKGHHQNILHIYDGVRPSYQNLGVPCPKGNCMSPLDVVATYAHVKGLLPEDVIRVILYPASAMQKMEVLMSNDPQNFTLPIWDSVLTTWNLTADMVEKDEATQNFDFSFIPNMWTMFEKDGKSLNWEFVGACTICLLAGVCSIAGPNKYSMWGILLMLWYIYLDGGRRSDVSVMPMYLLAFICSLGWVDFRNFFTVPPEPKAPAAATPAETKAKVEFKKKD